MTYYNFYIQDNDLVCETTINDITFYKFGNEAKELFKNLSNASYRNLIMSNDSIKFMGYNMRVFIKDYNNLLYRFGSIGGYNFIKQVKKKVFKEQLQRVADKVIEKSKHGIITVQLSASVLLLLTSLGKMNILGTQTPDYMIETIDMDLDNIMSSNDAKTENTPTIIKDLEKQVDEIIASPMHLEKLSTPTLEIKQVEKSEKKATEDILQDETPLLNQKTESYAYIECGEKGYSDDIIYVMENYGSLINEAANTYGISTNLLAALLTHESHGLHPENLMQIVFSAHSKPDKDEVKRAYNYVTGSYEDFVLTYDPSRYKNEDGTYKCTVYTKEDLADAKKNIMCGAAIFASYYKKYCENNIMAAIICYNQGPGTLKAVLRDTADAYNIEVSDILSDPANTLFIEKVHELDSGDKLYLEHVMQYVTDADQGIYMSKVDAENSMTKNMVYVTKTKQMTK